jgi:hypothetical protein
MRCMSTEEDKIYDESSIFSMYIQSTGGLLYVSRAYAKRLSANAGRSAMGTSNLLHEYAS